MTENPSIISHVSIGTNDFEKAIGFYDQVLPTLGCQRVMKHPDAIAYGKQYPEFWVNKPFNNQAATVGNGTHIGFIAPTKAAVEAFYAAALAAGGQGDGTPGGRAEYGEPYYGCFVRDLDGHKIEAAFWDETMEQP